MRWTVGEATIERLLNEGRLKRRPTFDPALNQRAFAKLGTKRESLELVLGAGDHESSVSIAHEIVRKALTCLLGAQGLDLDDVVGSHKTVETATLAQFGERGGPLHNLRYEIKTLRLLRHESEYESELTDIPREDATAARDTAVATLGVVDRLMPHLSIF